MRTHQAIFVVLGVALLLVGIATGDSPLKLNQLQAPGVIQSSAPLEWIRMYRASGRNPSALLRYLDDAYFFEPQGLDTPGNEFLSPLGQEYAEFRQYALVRLGDIAGTDLIPALEHYAQMYEVQSKRENSCNWVYEDFAELARLAIERIRLRAQGRNVYVQTMIQWLRTPIPTPGETNREVDKALMRITQGARALGVIKAREAVDALMERTKERSSASVYDDYVACECARALARIGDKRAMQVLREGVLRWITVYGAYNRQVPLEPGEPDMAWAYWEMRTGGMSTEQAVAELIRGLDEMIPGALAGLIHIGKPAEPALLALLKDPDVRSAVKVEVMGVLNGMGSREAVDIYLDILRRGDKLGPRAAASLGMLGAKEALSDLLKAAEQDDSRDLKEGAIQGLRELGDPAAEPLLLRLATQHPDPLVRAEAIKALAKAGTPAAIPVLEQRLQTEVDYLVGYIQNTIDALRKKKR